MENLGERENMENLKVDLLRGAKRATMVASLVVALPIGFGIGSAASAGGNCPEDSAKFWGGESHSRCITIDDIRSSHPKIWKMIREGGR